MGGGRGGELSDSSSTSLSSMTLAPFQEHGGMGKVQGGCGAGDPRERELAIPIMVELTGNGGTAHCKGNTVLGISTPRPAGSG